MVECPGYRYELINAKFAHTIMDKAKGNKECDDASSAIFIFMDLKSMFEFSESRCRSWVFSKKEGKVTDNRRSAY